MKKIYIAPKATAVELETSSLIADSNISVLSAGNGNDALEGSYRSSLWED